MSRIAKKPILVPAGVNVEINGSHVLVKGAKGSIDSVFHSSVNIALEDNNVVVSPVDGNKSGWMHAGTVRSIVYNMVHGVSVGFTKKLQLVGVGYRAKVQGRKVDLTLGFSHPIAYSLPDGIDAATPTQTEIVLTGVDKQKLGQVASEIRAFRPPEPYKGKGVRYADEHIVRKEAKKK